MMEVVNHLLVFVIAIRVKSIVSSSTVQLASHGVMAAMVAEMESFFEYISEIGLTFRGGVVILIVFSCKEVVKSFTVVDADRVLSYTVNVRSREVFTAEGIALIRILDDFTPPRNCKYLEQFKRKGKEASKQSQR